MTRNDYYSLPVRIRVKTKSGRNVSRLAGYGAIAKARAAGTLIAAWSTSTGKSIV